MTAAEQTATDLFADLKWRAAIEHAAGCQDCRTPGVGCRKGEQLLRVYEEAAQQARSDGAP